MVSLPFKEMVDVLLDAYPCCNFDINKQFQSDHLIKAGSGKCRQAKWIPEKGHIPRGFLGATGKPEDVKVVFVMAEPGCPHGDEKYQTDSSPNQFLEQCLNHTYMSFIEERNDIHKNVRMLLSRMFPGTDFDEQLRKAWLTESRLCSIKNKTGNGPRKVCAETYLLKQLNLVPNAVIIAFGKSKVVPCLKKLSKVPIVASSLSPPESRKPRAKESWDEAVEIVRSLN